MSTTRIVSILLVFICVVAAAMGFTFVRSRISLQKPSTVDTRISTIIQSQRTGDFAQSLAQTKAIQSDTTSTNVTKALSVINSLGAAYRLTGDINARLTDVQDLKKIVLDQTLPLTIRVTALNDLAAEYPISGGDSAVFAEIYKDQPFNSYLTTARDLDQTARLSARKLFEWSYSMEPTSLAAISISRWYSEQRVFNPDEASSTIKAYFDKAEQYLNMADTASIREAKEDPAYTSSTRYLEYLYWRAVIVGRLGGPKGEPYLSQYRATYDQFITFAKSSRNPLASEYILYARLFYAVRLSNDKDISSAKAQLDQLAVEINSVKNSRTNVFLRFLKNESKRPTGYTWQNMVVKQYPISPGFKAAIESVVGPATQ